jgi:hypothetical protein
MHLLGVNVVKFDEIRGWVAEGDGHDIEELPLESGRAVLKPGVYVQLL